MKLSRNKTIMGRCLLVPMMAAATMLLFGCPPPPSTPPVNMAAMEKMPTDGPNYFARPTIRQYNLTRVMDKTLVEKDRLDSMDVVLNCADNDPSVGQHFAMLYNEPSTPVAIRDRAKQYIQSNPTTIVEPPGGFGNVENPPTLPSPDGVQTKMEELVRVGGMPALAELAKIWAQEPRIDGPNELLYQQTARRIATKPWADAMLDGINSPQFDARGSAIEILVRRMTTEAIGRIALRMKGKTEPMRAMQLFLEKFDYVPANRDEFLSTATIYKARADLINDAAKLFRDWQGNYGYKFNIRDFHLLSQMARDPLRVQLSRSDLTISISKSLATRRHVVAIAQAGAKQGENNFLSVADKLSMADIWNIYLLDEMLSRPRVQIALNAMAVGDRNDKSTAWGGLILYQAGQAEAMLYPPAKEVVGSEDGAYLPTDRMKLDSRDSLCRFIGHFGQSDNSNRSGPTLSEFQDSKRSNYYGLVLTSISDDSFCAHYYNPAGDVVSLGIFSFRK